MIGRNRIHLRTTTGNTECWQEQRIVRERAREKDGTASPNQTSTKSQHLQYIVTLGGDLLQCRLPRPVHGLQLACGDDGLGVGTVIRPADVNHHGDVSVLTGLEYPRAVDHAVDRMVIVAAQDEPEVEALGSDDILPLVKMTEGEPVC